MIKYIQGDVILRKIDKLPKGLRQMVTEEKESTKILQKSETTGHHHHFAATATVDMYTSSQRDMKAIEALDFTTITPNEGKYIVVGPDGATLFHGKGFDLNPHANGLGDHCALSIPEGTYEIDIVREYDYERRETRRVID